MRVLRLLIVFVVFICSQGIVFSDEPAVVLNDRVRLALEAVKAFNQKENIVLSGDPSFTVNQQAVTFTNQIPLDQPVDEMLDPDLKNQFFSLSTIFLRMSPTIEKRIHMRLGPEEMARMRFKFQKPTQAWLSQFTFQENQHAWQIYEGSTDIFCYTQTTTPSKQIEVKEWIYAERPNSPEGSEYRWKMTSEEFNRFYELTLQSDGSVGLQRYPMVKYVAADDYKEHKRILAVVRKALEGVDLQIKGQDEIGRIQPVRYMNREGLVKQGQIQVINEKEMTIKIQESPNSYPLLIDPTFRSE